MKFNKNIFGNNNDAVDDNPFKSFSDDFISNAEKEKPAEIKQLDTTDVFNGDIPIEKANVLIPLDKLISAPSDWNLYPPADEETIVKMMESFAQYGQLKVAIVRDEGDGNYMIIGGHNRLTTLKRLHENFPDVERYKTMRCNVYSRDTINDEAFRIAVVEDNEAQRAKEDSRYIAVGYNVRKRFGEKSSIYKHGLEMRKKLMEKYGISNGTASNIEQIGSYLIQDYLSMYINGSLSRNDALVISRLDAELQEYMFKNKIFKLSVQAKKMLKNAKTADDVDAAIYAEKENTFDGMKIPSPPPKDNITIKLSIPEKIAEEYIKRLTVLCDEIDMPEDGKKYLHEILYAYQGKFSGK